LEPFFRQREAIATPAARAQIQAARARAAAAGHDTQFGYTEVSDRPLQELTGLVEPADMIKEMRAHNTRHAAAIAAAQAQAQAKLAAARGKTQAKIVTSGFTVNNMVPLLLEVAKTKVAGDC